jgi:undecaprenyl-diphosphatase
MDSLQIVVLAVIQGHTEFSPMPSSGPLALVSNFTNWPDQGLDFDLAVHIGTLLKWLTLFGMLPYVVYRLLPGAVLLAALV